MTLPSARSHAARPCSCSLGGAGLQPQSGPGQGRARSAPRPLPPLLLDLLPQRLCGARNGERPLRFAFLPAGHRPRSLAGPDSWHWSHERNSVQHGAVLIGESVFTFSPLPERGLVLVPPSSRLFKAVGCLLPVSRRKGAPTIGACNPLWHGVARWPRVSLLPTARVENVGK